MRRGRPSTRGFNKTPGKGTKLRGLILLMLRPQGTTVTEAVRMGMLSKQTLGRSLDTLRDYGGWDVRGFPVPNDSGSSHAHCMAYRIVGRHRDSGGYRSFISR